MATKRGATPETDTESDGMQGHPLQGQPAPETAPPPQLEKVSIGGKDYELPPDVAQAYKSEIGSRDQRISQTEQWARDLIATQSRSVTQPPTPAATQTPKPMPPGDFGVSLFTKPGETMDAYTAAKLAEFEETHLRPLRQQLEARNHQEQIDTFFRTFRKENKDLDNDEDMQIVEALAYRHSNDFTGIDPKTARTKLADMARQTLPGVVSRRASPASAPAQQRTRVEGASAPAARATEDTAAEPRGGLSDVIKARREARRKAAANLH